MPYFVFYMSWLLVSMMLLQGCDDDAPSDDTAVVNNGNFTSETHFLALCTNDCPGDLKCVCGVCTLTCTSRTSCDPVGRPEVMCVTTDQLGQCSTGATASGAICALQCNDDADCTSLSTAHTCANGLCVAPALSVQSTDDIAVDGAADATAPETSAPNCMMDEARCADMCVDLRSDPLHCGTCDVVCAQGQTCIDARCVEQSPMCEQSETLCAMTCADLLSDNDHCGACDRPCAVGSRCINAQCSQAP